MGNTRRHPASLFLSIGFVLILLFLAACQFAGLTHPVAPDTTIPSLTPTLTAQPRATRAWPSPVATAVTPVPDPMKILDYPPEVESIVLLGLDQDFPFSGRTDAIYLILYNRRINKASIISIPPDLFVYLPGYTMQRINNAYPIGGISLVKDTLEYNLGISIDHYLLLQFSDFPKLVDAVGGIDVVVVDDLTEPCQLQPGSVHMGGGQAFCYAIYRKGEDDVERNRRQLQVMRAFFLRMMLDGQIMRLPELAAEFGGSVQTDLSLADLMKNIPLAVQLTDPQRIGYYQISWDEVIQWMIPGRAKTIVLLPNQQGLEELLDEAYQFVMVSVPVSDLPATLAAQLTRMILPTATATSQPMTPTPSPTPSQTSLPGTVQPSVTPTPTSTVTIAAYP